MTGRERLLATFKHQPVDRIAISPFLYYNAVYEMFDYVPSAEGKKRVMDQFFDPPDFDPMTKFVEYCQYFGFDVLHNLGTDWWFSPFFTSDENWDVTTTTEGEGDEKHLTTVIRTPGGDLRTTQNVKRSSKYLVVSALEENVVKTREDWDLIRKYAPPMDRLDLSLVHRAKDAVGDTGMMSTCSGEAFNVTAGFFRNLELGFMDPLTDEGWYRDMMEFSTEALIKQHTKLIEAGVEVVEVTGNLCTSVAGPQFYRDYVLEYDKRIIDAVHRDGAFTNFHNCGDSMKLLEAYNELNTDSLGYLTPPPFGDVDIDEALKILDPNIILRGNIDQVEFMIKATPAEVKQRVRELIEKVKDRGNFILSTTDFFFDGTPYDNIRAFVDAAVEYGSY